MTSIGDGLVAELPRLRRAARKLDHRMAEDAVQEACLRALRYEASFDGRDLGAWLAVILRNALADLRRADQRQRIGAELRPAHDHAEAEQERWIEARECLDSLAGLPPAWRAAVLAVAEQDVGYGRAPGSEGYAAAARRLGVPVGTVKSRVSRARAMLGALNG